MTNSEFNVKYSHYLEERHYGMSLLNSEAIEYMDKEFQNLVKIPGFKYQQIKSKFNYFCFYCTNVPVDKVHEIESNLAKICRKPDVK